MHQFMDFPGGLNVLVSTRTHGAMFEPLYDHYVEYDSTYESASTLNYTLSLFASH